MTFPSSKKLQNAESKLKSIIDDEAVVASIMEIFIEAFDMKKIMQQQREANQRLRDKKKMVTGTTYDATAKQYYENNKEKLNKDRTERARSLRVSDAAV